MSKAERKRIETRKYRMKSWTVRVRDPPKPGYIVLNQDIKTKVPTLVITETFAKQREIVEKALTAKLKSKGYKPIEFMHMTGFVDVKRMKK